MAKGADMSAHPKHSDRHPYKPAEILKLRKGDPKSVKAILSQATKAKRT
jgi:hypothetical protein